MKFILFVMLFVALPAAGPKNEGGRVWSLQSTSTLEFATEQGCDAAGLAITDSLTGVNTVTMRGWCFCESTDPLKRCPAPDAKDSASRKILESLRLKTPENVSTGIKTFVPPN